MFEHKATGNKRKEADESLAGACRICLTETDCQNIFELDYEGQDIVDIFCLCTRIELVKELNNPDYVCVSCVSELLQAYEFIKKCQASHEYLLLIPKISEEKKNGNQNDLLKTEEIFIEVTDEGQGDKDKKIEESVPKEIDDVDVEETDVKRRKASHKCPICSKGFSTVAGLKNHSWWHTNSNSITSENSGDGLANEVDDDTNAEELETEDNHGLEEHTKTDTNTKDSLDESIDDDTTDTKKVETKRRNNHKCSVCPKEFSTSAGLKNHFRTHEDSEESIEKKKQDKRLKDLEVKGLNGRKCPKCAKEFTSLAGLKIHYRSHGNSTAFTCKVCKKTFTSKKNRGQHMLTHSNERPFRCKECDRGFNQKKALQIHMMIHTGERPIVCEFCAKGFKEVKDLKYHHNKGDCTKFDEDRNEPTSCNICLSPLKSYRALRQHYSLFHSKKEYLCNECGKGFISAAGLKQHMQIHTGNRPYVCDVCNKAFSMKRTLKNHSYLHTGERPYRCHICEKTFVQEHHLTTHMRMHSGEKPYTCQICSKSFTMKSNLTVHIRTHTGETPYVCDVCDTGFHDSSSLRKHKLKHGSTMVKKPDKTCDVSQDEPV